MDKMVGWLLVLHLTFTHGELGHEPGSTVRSKRQLPGLQGPEDYGLGYLSSPRMLDVQRRIMGQMENELQLQLMAKFNAQMDKKLNKDENKLTVKQNTDLPDEKMQASRDNIAQPENNVVSVPDQSSGPSPLTNNQQTSFLPLQPAYTQFVPYNDLQMGSPPVLQPVSMTSEIPTSPFQFGQMVPVDAYTSFRANGAIPPGPQSTQVPLYGPSVPSGPSKVPRMEPGSTSNGGNLRVPDSGIDGKKASKIPKEWQFLMSEFKPREGRSLGSPYTGSFGRESRMQDVPRSKPSVLDEWEAYRMRKKMELQQSTTTTTTTVSPLMAPQAVPGMHARMLDRDSSPQKTSRTKFRYI